MLDKLIARTKNTFNKAHIDKESPVEGDGWHENAAPPTKMGYSLRSLARRAFSQPAEDAKPRKLQKKKQPGATRAKSSESRTEPAEPQPARSASDDDGKPKETDDLEAMKPIGEYPSLAEYKGVGLTPPVKDVAGGKRAPGGMGVMTDAFALADEEVMSSAGMRVDDGVVGDDPHRGVENVASRKGCVESVLGENPLSGPAAAEEVPPPASFSLVGSPADTTVDETMTDCVPTVPDTHITAPDVGTQSPQMHPADGMVFDSEKTINRDYIAVLNSLPLPASNSYDVSQLKRVLEVAISNSQEAGDDNVALSLVHFWSQISQDEFKLALIHNMGCEISDHKLELALKAMLRHSVDDATKWYEAHELDCAKALSHSGTGLSFGRSPGAEPLGQSPFRVADIYRDTSGPRLEEAFITGKTNTVPLKRPKKPVPVNENPFKRRREWEADPTLEDVLREKRARLSEAAASEGQVSQRSSVRPDPVPDTQMEESSILAEPRRRTSLPAEGTADVVRAAAAPSTSRLQRAAKGRQAQKGKGKQRPETVTGGPAAPRTSARAAAHPTPALPAVSSTYEPDRTHPFFSPKIRSWGLGRIHPSLFERSQSFDNMDECYVCEGTGELLCCDTCENALHFECVRPRLDPNDPLEGEWHCRRCDAEATYNKLSEIVESPGESRRGSLKSEYSVPKETREYFIGVGEFETTLTGSRPDLVQRYYNDVPHLPRLTKLPPKNAPRLEYNDPELLKLFDNNGRPILCKKCGLSTHWERPIIRCDYCENRFHLDCLDPPLANPPDPVKGWMCPTHIRPDELVVSKMVNGRIQQRRVRRPKATFASVDLEVDTTDDFRETTFDEDWRESRGHLPAGDIVLDFVTSVKQKNKNVMRDYCEGITKASMDWIKKRHAAHLQQLGIPLEGNELPEAFSTDLAAAVENMRTGKIPVEQYNAAFDLLTLSQGGPNVTPAPASNPRPASAPTPSVGQRKRSRTEHEEDSGEPEPALKRQNTNSD